MRKGFTLIELLIVIAIIAILAVVVFVALDPLTRFEKARDAQRWSDVDAILEAATLDQVDNGGEYFTELENLSPNTYNMIGTATTGCNTGCDTQSTQVSCFDLTTIADDGYLAEIPVDPVAGDETKTLYYLFKDPTGFLTVGACNPEDTTSIEISR